MSQVQRLTQRPLFVCVPFSVPENALVVAEEALKGRELLFDCGTVALSMEAKEFWSSVRPFEGRISGALAAQSSAKKSLTAGARRWPAGLDASSRPGGSVKGLRGLSVRRSWALAALSLPNNGWRGCRCLWRWIMTHDF